MKGYFTERLHSSIRTGRYVCLTAQTLIWTEMLCYAMLLLKLSQTSEDMSHMNLTPFDVCPTICTKGIVCYISQETKDTIQVDAQNFCLG